jgi:co-chaperonin GroES (HSP10)
MVIQGNAILILPDRLPERTKTGQLIIPKSSKEMASEWGTVIDMGPACEEVKKRMRVIFPRKQASVITMNDIDYYFVSEHQIKYMI